MKQEDKDLLLRYVSMALPYGVIINTPNGDGYLNSINRTIFGNEYGININPTRRDYFNDEENNIKPYLRPLSSMTEDEREYFEGLSDMKCTLGYARVKVNFCLKRHLDINGLISKGLAIEVTEENNPYNIKEE